MITLEPEEQIVKVMRRHWWVMVGPSFLVFFLLLVPSVIAVFMPLIAPQLQGIGNWQPIAQFAFSLYLLFLLEFAFAIWTNYYLDVWIITTERIIDIEQKGLFRRVISEFPINRVQNVSIEVRGVIETLLKFGDLTVETAGGHASFVIKEAPDLYRAKDLILHYSQQEHG